MLLPCASTTMPCNCMLSKSPKDLSILELYITSENSKAVSTKKNLTDMLGAIVIQNLKLLGFRSIHVIMMIMLCILFLQHGIIFLA